MMAILIMACVQVVFDGQFRARPDDETIYRYFRRSVVAFPLAALAALAMFVISEVSYQDATSVARFARRARRPRATGSDLVAKSLLDAETGQRGYLLTNRQEYLNPYARRPGRPARTDSRG